MWRAEVSSAARRAHRVMAALVAAIHATTLGKCENMSRTGRLHAMHFRNVPAWMAGTSPARTAESKPKLTRVRSPAAAPGAWLPPAAAKKLPRYPVLPAMLIGRLAVATKRQGQGQGLGLGRALIADAIIRTESSSIGAYALIVDANDERARAFYASNGFASIPDEARRMFLPMATALQLLENERGG